MPVVSRDPRAWVQAARTWAEFKHANAPATDGRPKFPLTYEKSAPGADLANPRVRFRPNLEVFAHDLPPAAKPRRPKRSYCMRSDTHGQYFTVFDKATGVPIATLRGDRDWVHHEVMRYARSLRATSQAFRVLPCIAPDSRGDWAASDTHVRGSYVCP